MQYTEKNFEYVQKKATDYTEELPQLKKKLSDLRISDCYNVLIKVARMEAFIQCTHNLGNVEDRQDYLDSLLRQVMYSHGFNSTDLMVNTLNHYATVGVKEFLGYFQ